MPAHQRFPRRSEEAHLVQGADGLPLESRAQGPLSPNGAHQDRAREEAAPGVGSLAPRVQRAPLVIRTAVKTRLLLKVLLGGGRDLGAGFASLGPAPGGRG